MDLDTVPLWVTEEDLVPAVHRPVAVVGIGYALFTEESPVWTADQIIARLHTSRATVYRYLQAPTAAGFLSQLARGAYTLGPRIIELDRQIRIADPLLGSLLP